MLNFLDASHYKLTQALSKITGQQDSAPYKFSSYMETSLDKHVSYLPASCL